jgi:hypothetical protein
MRAQIRNHRGVATADLDIDGVVLIAGDNNQGKSSTLSALAAAATGRGLPEGMTKGAAGQLVRAGADDGFVALSTDAGKMSIPFPSLEAVGTGRPPRASLYAAGLVSLLDQDDKARSRALIELLKAEPTKDDLAQAFLERGIWTGKPEGMPEEMACPLMEQVWSKIEATGWDGAHDAAVKRGTKLKGAWDDITGKKYGSKVADGWSPEGWLPEYATETVDDLTTRLATAKTALETALTGAAVDGAERERRAASAARVEDLTAQIAGAEEALAAAQAELEPAEAHRKSLPDGAGYIGIPCPHCQGMVVTSRTTTGAIELHKAQKDIPDEEKRRQRLAIADADGNLSNIRGRIATCHATLGKLRSDLGAAQADAEWLAANPPKEGAGANIPAARQAVSDLEALLRLVSTKQRAAERHAEVVANQVVIDLLAPGGLRKKKLGEVIEAFNTARLAPLCATARWQSVEVREDLSITYGGRPYALLSASEQWRVKVVVQIAMAKLDGSDLVLIDAADILSSKRRNGLMALLATMEVPVVVAMTYGTPEKVPDLADAKMGRTYWIADGVASPLAAVKQQLKKAA